jgi:hypothetical protein
MVRSPAKKISLSSARCWCSRATVFSNCINEGKTEQEVVAMKPLADLDAKWAANRASRHQPHARTFYQSFKRF